MTGGDGLLRVASPGVQAALASAEACPLPGNTAVLAYAPNAAFTVPVACDPYGTAFAWRMSCVSVLLQVSITWPVTGLLACLGWFCPPGRRTNS